ncbi:MAG TPA: hypothetical protein VFR51_01535 [Pyrinomonadaceae bacterium]|nr:hypothetical protein [Pyrinomonadaceae bacterium]
MVNEQLEDSLRREIESYVDSRLSAVRQEIATLQSLLNESLSTFLDRQADVQMEGSLVASITEHLHAAHERGVELASSQTARAKASSDMAIVKSAITEITEQKSQAEVLKALVNRASSFAPRVAFFVVKGDTASGWRGRGFEGTIGDEAVQQISLSLSSDTVISSAAKSLTTWSGGPGSHSEDHSLINRLGEEPPQRIVAVPLTVRGKAVAVLYADSAGLDSESINLEALETLVAMSSMAVELLSVSRGAAAAPKRVAEEVAAPAPEPEPSYTPAAEYQPEPPAPVKEETSFPGAETIESYQAEPVAPESLVEAAPGEEEPAGLYDTSAAEPEAAWTSSPPVEAAPEPAPRRRYGQDSELPVEVSGDEERRLHNDARRFARLLISEIKLYNEQKVAEGRSEHDLYDRLREYIDRSREMYDKRVKAEVAARYDYFHGELVNTLAEGDASKLGANYPGATVNA